MNELVSSAITLPGSPSQLSFKNNYNMEANASSTSVGYDGGVLEIKIGAGAFTDILAAGGSFVTGGYNRTISGSYNNPLANRSAWSGNSAGFIITTVNLPAVAAGQTVQFRWRCGTDSSVTGSGWYIDSIEISASICCGDVIAPVINTQPLSQTVPAGSPVNFFVSAIGTAPLGYQWYFNSNLISSATATNYAIASVQATNVGGYFVVVTNSVGATTSSVATLNLVATNAVTGILAGWNVSSLTGFGASPFPPTTNAAHLAIAGLTRGSGVTTTGSAAARAWGGNGWNSSSVTAAVTANRFATFSVTANAGYMVSFASISKFDYRRSGFGPTNGTLQYQIGTNAFTDITKLAYSSSSTSGSSLSAIDLSNIAQLQNVGPGTNVMFRIVNYGASNGTGTWYIYDVGNNANLDFTLQGTVAPVPVIVTNPPAIAPSFSLAAFTNNQFQFTLTGTTGSNYIVQASTNLAEGNWISLQTNAAPFMFVESNVDLFLQRFYRALLAP